jgi:hypothetical protein
MKDVEKKSPNRYLTNRFVTLSAPMPIAQGVTCEVLMPLDRIRRKLPTIAQTNQF